LTFQNYLFEMKKKRILSVFGTRPEAIKMAPIVLALNSSEYFESAVCVTGQHRQMLDQVLNLFEIHPEYDLNLMSQNQDLFDVTCKTLTGLRDVFEDYRPDLILVHGDTTSCFAASLAAFYKKVKVGHVEAGLRTWNLQSPWPEEANRQLTDCIADFYFAPTDQSKDNLITEGRDKVNICVTGNTVIDALLNVAAKLGSSVEFQQQAAHEIVQGGYPHIAQQGRRRILITGHRRENFGEGMLQICRAVKEVAAQYPDVDLIYPVHLNPNVQEPVRSILNGLSNVYLIDPLDYVPFVYMMANSHFILTDSGGIQEEGPALGKPVLVMRDTTERPEAVKAGTVRLVGNDSSSIATHCTKLLESDVEYLSMATSTNPFGDGRAAGRILDFLKERL
jgi:UDP-N-acetylglucosamine 2-epimerase (non-hydrolysing)